MNNIKDILFVNFQENISKNKFPNIYDKIKFIDIKEIDKNNKADVLVLNTEGLDITENDLIKLENYPLILIDKYSYIYTFISLRKNQDFYFLYKDDENNFLNILEFFIKNYIKRKKTD